MVGVVLEFVLVDCDCVFVLVLRIFVFMDSKGLVLLWL